MQFRRESLAGGSAQRLLAMDEAGHPLRHASVIQKWAEDEEFVRRFVRALGDTPYASFFWECPALDARTRDLPYECVLTDAPELARKSADPSAFERAFALLPDDAPIVRFANLSGDAELLAPRPGAAPASCADLARFARSDDWPRQRALFAALGRRLSEPDLPVPVWVSTSGLGVPWLHIRLDRRPKYYTHAPYTMAARPAR